MGIAVKMKAISQLVVWKTEISRLRLKAERKGLLVGEVGSIVSLTKQQIAVYKMAQKADTAEQGSGECQVELSSGRKGI